MRLILPASENAQPDLCGLWVTLHAVYRQWSLARPDAPERADIAAHLERQLVGLAHIPAEDWHALLAVQLSLAAYSWCKGGTMKPIMKVWEQIYEAALAAP